GLSARVRPAEDWSVYGLVDYALTKDQTLRVSFDHGQASQENLGVGGFDLSERAYSNANPDTELRVHVVGPLGRRTFANTRLQLQESDSVNVSSTNARTVIVNGAFTSGGAQVSGGRRPRHSETGSGAAHDR